MRNVRWQKKKKWLSNNCGFLTSAQLQEVASLFFDSRPQHEILCFGKVIVDANDLSSLGAERYLTGFLIDGVRLKFCQEVQATTNSFICMTINFTVLQKRETS